jgi:hypothetical protein
VEVLRQRQAVTAACPRSSESPPGPAKGRTDRGARTLTSPEMLGAYGVRTLARDNGAPRRLVTTPGRCGPTTRPSVPGADSRGTSRPGHCGDASTADIGRIIRPPPGLCRRCMVDQRACAGLGRQAPMAQTCSVYCHARRRGLPTRLCAVTAQSEPEGVAGTLVSASAPAGSRTLPVCRCRALHARGLRGWTTCW